MSDRKVKTAGVLSDEKLNGLKQVMRKFGYYSCREDVWHAVDTALHWRELAAVRMTRICELEAELEELRGDNG